MALELPIKVAILDDYQGVAFTSADWSSLKDRLAIDVFSDTISDEDSLVQRLLPYTIICAMRERTKFTASLLARLGNLRFIATTGPWNAGIDIAYAEQNGIVVSGTGAQGNSTLEHIWALILGTVRYVPMDDADVKARKSRWQTHMPMGLAGRTLGVIGLGQLGSKTAQIAKAFGMRVIAWSPNLTPARAEAAGCVYSSKKELFQNSDVVSIHIVSSPRTRHLITATDLSIMKPSAFFINTSRGPIVNEDDLIDVLQRKTIAGAGLDVFDIEPLPLEHPFRNLDNVVLTPHMGYVSDSNYEAFWGQTVENIVNFLDGKPSRVLQSS